MTERAKKCYHEHHNLAVETYLWWCNPDLKWKGKQCFFSDKWFFTPRSCAQCNMFFVFAQAGTKLPPLPNETAELFKLIDSLQIPTPSKVDAHHIMMDRGLKVYNLLIAKVKELFPSHLVVSRRWRSCIHWVTTAHFWRFVALGSSKFLGLIWGYFRSKDMLQRYLGIIFSFLKIPYLGIFYMINAKIYFAGTELFLKGYLFQYLTSIHDCKK
jgi:hypothetical protein